MPSMNYSYHYSQDESRRQFAPPVMQQQMFTSQVFAPERPTFKDKDDPVKFLKEITSYGKQINVPLDYLFHSVLNHALTGLSHGWFMKTKRPMLNWQGFASALLAYLGIRISNGINQTNVDVCAGGKMKIRNTLFSERMSNWEKVLPNMGESERANFIAGLLNPTYQKRIRRNFFTGVDDLLSEIIAARALIERELSYESPGNIPVDPDDLQNHRRIRWRKTRAKKPWVQRNHAFNVRIWWWKAQKMTTNPCLKNRWIVRKICRI